MVNGNKKNHFWYVFKNKIVASALSVSHSLPLVQLKYSLINVFSQPQANDVLNRLATSIS